MSEPARILPFASAITAPASGAAEGVLLGPGTVVEVSGLHLLVHVSGEPAPRRARAALAVPYRAVPGDEVLVLGKGSELWVVGLIAGTGTTSLEIPGDVSLRAKGGSLRLEGDLGVEIRGAEVRVETPSLAVIAGKVVEKMDAFYQRVRGLVSVHAERMHTTVDESTVTTAKASTLLVEETASINGKQIHLG